MIPYNIGFDRKCLFNAGTQKFQPYTLLLCVRHLYTVHIIVNNPGTRDIGDFQKSPFSVPPPLHFLRKLANLQSFSPFPVFVSALLNINVEKLYHKKEATGTIVILKIGTVPVPGTRRTFI
jgi:hypothetical protein